MTTATAPEDLRRLSVSVNCREKSRRRRCSRISRPRPTRRKGPARLAALRAGDGARRAATGFSCRAPTRTRANTWPIADKRLAWLTGFTGSAGFCIALADVAGVFVDGRYRNQVRGQVDLAAFTPVDWPETEPGRLAARSSCPMAARSASIAWLHSRERDRQDRGGARAAPGSRWWPVDNLVDRDLDRPARPAAGADAPAPDRLCRAVPCGKARAAWPRPCARPASGRRC